MGLLTARKPNPVLLQLQGARDRNERIRVCARLDGQRVLNAHTRILELEPDGVLLYWPGEEFTPALQQCVTIECFFNINGTPHTFAAAVRGRRERRFPRLGQVSVLHLGLPARIEARQQRARFRVSLHAGPVLQASIYTVDRARLLYQMRIVNLSGGGALALTEDRTVRQLALGDQVWIAFMLPDDPLEFGFQARLAHRNELNTRNGGFALGWAFVPPADPRLHAETLQRIEKFVAARQRAQLRRAR